MTRTSIALACTLLGTALCLAQATAVLVDGFGRVVGPYQSLGAVGGQVLMTLRGRPVAVQVEADGTFTLGEAMFLYDDPDCFGQNTKRYIAWSTLVPRGYVSGPAPDTYAIAFPTGERISFTPVKVSNGSNGQCVDPPGPGSQMVGRAGIVSVKDLGLSQPFTVQVR